MPFTPEAKLFVVIAAAFGALAVALGAFGAHGLKHTLSEAQLGVWQTAVQYQFYHALALLLVAVLLSFGLPLAWLKVSGWLLVTGVVLFSGSLYVLALGGPKFLGPVTPLGGIAFIIAWVTLFVAAAKS